MSDIELKASLERGMQDMGLEGSCEQLLDYLNLLYKWNKAYNLTAIRSLDHMVSRHILDSLAILPWIHGGRLLDVGTGAGLPGIPLAIMRPELHVVLLDSNGKKTRFLQEVKRALALKNVEIVQLRVENYHPEEVFDTVTSRAFSDLSHMLMCTKHLIAVDGLWLAMKGPAANAELTNINFSYEIKPYTIPGSEGARCCVLVKNKD